MNYSDSSGVVSSNASSTISSHDAHGDSVDTARLTNAITEILQDMDQGACAETITQTVQVITLANGKKAAVRVLVTTDSDLFM